MTLLFWRLMLAHLIADFPLQTNAIYALKVKGVWGQVLHGEILFVTSVILTLPYLHLPLIWVYLFFITFAHIFQDYIKVKYFKKSGRPFWPFLLDQLLHALSTAVIFLFPLNNIQSFLSPSNIIFAIYNNKLLVYFLVTYIFSTWGGIYFIDTFKRTFLKDERFFKDAAGGFIVLKEEKYYGLLERLMFTTFAFFGGWYYLLIPLSGAFRFLFKKLSSLSISLLGMLISIIAGTILRIASF